MHASPLSARRASSVTASGSPSSPGHQSPPRRSNSRVDLRRSVDALVNAHDAMGRKMDDHLRNRRSIDVCFSDVASRIRHLEQRLKLRQHDTNMASSPTNGDPRSSLMDPSMVLVSRLEADLEFATQEGRILQEQRSERSAMCAAIEDAIRNEEHMWHASSERRSLSECGTLYRECAAMEAKIRSEENRMIESQEHAEAAELEIVELKKVRAERLGELQRQFDRENNHIQDVQTELQELEEALVQRSHEKSEWERKIREDLVQRNSPYANRSSPKNKLEAERRDLESRRDSLLEELRKTEKLSYALRQSEAESLRDPSQAMITSVTRPVHETEAMIWEATRPVRNVLSLRDTILILKARLLNLYDDLDEISETVDVIRGDPQYSMYAAFSEQSNQWRQQKLYDAFHDAVQLMRNHLYEEDGAAARALLRQLKYFVVVYDLFENHYDAVVNAIMLSDGKWSEAEEMLEAAQQCRRTIQSEQRRPSSLKRRSTSAASVNTGGASGAAPARTVSMRR